MCKEKVKLGLLENCDEKKNEEREEKRWKEGVINKKESDTTYFVDQPMKPISLLNKYVLVIWCHCAQQNT